jgi:hypothetical protein
MECLLLASAVRLPQKASEQPSTLLLLLLACAVHVSL